MTERLQCTIRPIRVDDAEAINAIRRQPSVLEGTFGIPSERPAQSRAFLESLGPDDHMLVAEVDGRMAGVAGLHVRHGKQRHVASFGIMVDESHQGRGVGRQLTEAILDLADNYLGLARVELDVFADNARAIRLYESLGFEREGVKRKDTLRRGGFGDTVIMGRLR